MRFVVTGAAGFIGSTLSEQLIRDGHAVVGIDSFDPYYESSIKEMNLDALCDKPDFELIRGDVRELDLDAVLRHADCVFHLAAMPGLMQSWEHFDRYVSANICATQRVAKSVLRSGAPRLIHVSTSSVYGRNAVGNESAATNPVSPYGVTKLAAENLIRAYSESYSLPAIILRYFSVYGPRQRPDMAYNIFVSKALRAEPITIFGDGRQTRSSTFVNDCVQGTIRAALYAPIGGIYNVGGGDIASLSDVLRHITELTGSSVPITFADARPGDQQHTAADCSAAAKAFGYSPATSLYEGLRAQVEWQRAQNGR